MSANVGNLVYMPTDQPNLASAFSSDRPMAAASNFILAVASAGLGFFLTQGIHINVEDFFTPGHHDDFDIFSGQSGLFLTYPRPISYIYMYNMGSIGVGIYYSIYTVLWLSNISLTQIFTFKALGVQPRALPLVLATFVISATWFSLAPSVGMLQYIGLSTNALSFCFAMLASVLLMSSDRLPWSAQVGCFFALACLSAFSKEDMIVFLLMVSILRGYVDHLAGTSIRSSAIKTVILMVACVFAYAASVLHSRRVGSPFTGGIGPYDVSNALQNIARNAVFYTTASPATKIVLIGLMIVFVCGLGVALLRKDPRGFRTCIVCLCAVAPIAPYLILPRNFDFYSAGFVPICLAVAFPLLTIVLSGIIPRQGVLAVATLALGSLTLLLEQVDRDQRDAVAAWNMSQRQASRVQISELRRAKDIGLEDCKRVLVTGLGNQFGPFISYSSQTATRIVSRQLQWRIVTEPNTMMAQFVEGKNFTDPAWQYVQTAALNSLHWGKEGDCRLAFSKSLRADLKK